MPGLPGRDGRAPPDEGEGHGEPGEDLGPADPADEPFLGHDNDEAGGFLGDDDPDHDLDAFEAWRDDEAARLTLMEYLELQRDLFQRVGSGASWLVAEAVGDLISEARILGCPANAVTFLARRDAMLADRR